MDDQNKKDEQTKPEANDAATTPEAPSEKKAVTPEPAAPAETPEAPVTPAEQDAPATPVTPEQPSDMSGEPVPQPMAPDVGYTETKSSKLVYILVGILLVILLSLVGLFFYKQMTATPAESQLSPTPAQVSPTSVVSPTVTPVNDEEAELQQIDIPDIDEDLQQIESDLNKL